ALAAQPRVAGRPGPLAVAADVLRAAAAGLGPAVAADLRAPPQARPRRPGLLRRPDARCQHLRAACLRRDPRAPLHPRRRRRLPLAARRRYTGAGMSKIELTPAQKQQIFAEYQRRMGSCVPWNPAMNWAPELNLVGES